MSGGITEPTAFKNCALRLVCSDRKRHLTGCRSAAASALEETVKKPTISRAKRSAAWACSALRHPAVGLRVACADHPILRSHRHDGRSGGITRMWDHAVHNEP